ncbi:heme A synthase, partial [Schumannella luteola]
MRLRTPLGWAADRWTLGDRALRWSTTAALVVSVLIVLGGVTVRVTGSGLGCPTWPTCTEDSLAATPELGIHGAIEFGNRLVTTLLIAAVGWAIIAARLQKPRDRTMTRLAWSMFWLVVANALAGGVTVWMGLNP